MPYFDPEPKRRREDFYDMEEELEDFVKAVERDKLIVVKGLRRYGKTSLILTGLNSVGARYVLIDCRLLPEGFITIKDFASLIEAELSRRSWAANLLRRIDSVSFAGVRMRFRNYDLTTVAEILARIGDAVIVIDEAQELRRSRHRFDSLIAHLYDYSDARVVVSGSQIGMLHRFLRVDDPDAPLYGRPYTEIKLRKLDDRQARDFLIRGFRQEGVSASSDVVDDAVRAFGGVIGWLTYFGYMYSRVGKRSVDEVLDIASSLALQELEHALSLYSLARRRYVEVLKTIATLGEAGWSEIKRSVEARLGRIPDTALANILRNLVDLSIVLRRGRRYVIADNVLAYAIRHKLR